MASTSINVVSEGGAEPPESYPLPWYAGIEPNDEDQTAEVVVVRAANHRFVSDANVPDEAIYEDETGEAMADYIVTACNSYPVLLEAVREAIDLRGCPGYRITAVLKAALDKIGGE